MISKLLTTDFQAILHVVNNAAMAYKGIIPVDRWKEPYMHAEELREEIESGVQFYGWKENDILIAVMGIQLIDGVTLIRHAYVLTAHQRKGLGEKLLNHLMGLAKTSRIYIGTWTAAWWAIKFYQKHEFELVSTQEKNELLGTYWNIPTRQVETSVVLQLKRLPQ
jgi:GNAT superfamily N-acetyltransferase